MRNNTYILTPELRIELKAPLGPIIRGSMEETVRELEALLGSIRPVKVISVGDVVSGNILKRGLPLDVFIVDNKSMRKPIEPLKFRADKTLRLTNPAGTISDGSWRIIGEAINSGGLVKVLVDGEEDLLTLVAVMMAPENSIVVYGQPDEGIVVIRVTEEAKSRIRKIIDRMEYKPES